jgi:endonuclease/exonuclease/phosphatase family metal-dependent hydrolase
VATYNIHRARGLDGKVSLSRIGDVLRQIDADVVGVQEVYEPQAETLARDLGMQLVTGVTVHRSDGAYGNAVLTRLPLQGVATFDLSVHAREAGAGFESTWRSGSRPSTSSTSTWDSGCGSARSK